MPAVSPSGEPGTGSDVLAPTRRSLDLLGERAERSLVAVRGGAGLVLLVAPGVVSQLWLGRRSARSRWFVRAIGIRDLALCTGQVRARSPRDRRRWQRVGGVADLSDAVLAIASAVTRRHPVSAAIAVPAVGAAVVTLASSRTA